MRTPEQVFDCLESIIDERHRSAETPEERQGAQALIDEVRSLRQKHLALVTALERIRWDPYSTCQCAEVAKLALA